MIAKLPQQLSELRMHNKSNVTDNSIWGIIMNRIFLVAPLCFLVVSSASAVPSTATVAVDCNVGQSISKALTRPAAELTIEISGICQEEVKISRTHVTLRGTTGPATDGIRAVAGGFDRIALDVVGVNTINIENLSLTGGPTAGLGINASFGVNVVDCLIEDNLFAGVIVGTASGSIDLVDTVITSTGDPRRGIWLTNGSSVDCIRCTIENHRTAILLTQGSLMQLADSTAQGTRRGVDASGGSRFVSDVFFATSPSTIEGGSQAAIILTGNASADLGSLDLINGKIRLEGKSVLTIAGSSQSNPSFFNSVESGASLVARDSASLDGDFDITEFSTVTLPSGSTVSGSLSCSLGADAVCGSTSDVTGSSDCNQCFIP